MRREFPFKIKIIRSNRQTTNLSVVADTAVIRTNLVTTDRFIEELLVKHKSWITKQLLINQEKEEHFLLLGKKYRIEKIASEKYGYQFKDDVLLCYVDDEKELTNIYDDIYFAHQEKLKTIIQHCLDNFPLKPKEIRIKRLSKTYGICHNNKKISINLYVLKYSREFIEMVIYHELCHLQEMNHSAKFYQLLQKYAPNYRELKKEART